jgi:hypothetical protein
MTGLPSRDSVSLLRLIGHIGVHVKGDDARDVTVPAAASTMNPADVRRSGVATRCSQNWIRRKTLLLESGIGSEDRPDNEIERASHSCRRHRDGSTRDGSGVPTRRRAARAPRASRPTRIRPNPRATATTAMVTDSLRTSSPRKSVEGTGADHTTVRADTDMGWSSERGARTTVAGEAGSCG